MQITRLTSCGLRSRAHHVTLCCVLNIRSSFRYLIFRLNLSAAMTPRSISVVSIQSHHVTRLATDAPQPAELVKLVRLVPVCLLI